MLAASDPGRAEDLAGALLPEGMTASALSGVARALAVTDLGRAEHLAQSITDDAQKVAAMAHIAKIALHNGPAPSPSAFT